MTPVALFPAETLYMGIGQPMCNHKEGCLTMTPVYRAMQSARMKAKRFAKVNKLLKLKR